MLHLHSDLFSVGERNGIVSEGSFRFCTGPIQEITVISKRYGTSNGFAWRIGNQI